MTSGPTSGLPTVFQAELTAIHETLIYASHLPNHNTFKIHVDNRASINPDSNFSLPQICHDKSASKLTKASKSPWDELAASLHCKLIANYSKNRVRTQPGIKLATYRLVT
ncbi:hypothetical protein AVEN_107150-1 [Araneus ventricosus]|uniref:Uncharacterized protein n=1 Tax=Araneus ventricosus TaxID=182803 RepID=A0A4Y2I504_ARAVE|nr:hypothetical protein AVEN_107150-1 [Araneus ventricosus]